MNKNLINEKNFWKEKQILVSQQTLNSAGPGEHLLYLPLYLSYSVHLNKYLQESIV